MKEECQSRNKNLTVPNLISCIRIIIIPFFAVFYMRGNLTVAVVLLVASGLSDLVDGWIARKFDQVTELGKMLDPLADKLTQGTVALCLAIRIEAIRWVLVIFILKELLMVICGIVLIRRNKKPSAAKWYGKVSTFLFYISVTIIVFIRSYFEMENSTFETLSTVLLGITAVFMIYSAVRYFKVFIEILKTKDDTYNFDLKSEIKERKIKK